MPQRLDSICGVIELLRFVDNTAATFIPPIPCGLTITLHSRADMNARESKAGLIDDIISSSITGFDCIEYEANFYEYEDKPSREIYFIQSDPVIDDEMLSSMNPVFDL